MFCGILGALVWFARVIEWEFPGFSVDACAGRLLAAQQMLERDGCIEGRIHRILLAAAKTRRRSHKKKPAPACAGGGRAFTGRQARSAAF